MTVPTMSPVVIVWLTAEGEISQAIGSLQKASELARGTAMQKYADDFIVELQQKSH